VPTNKNLTLDTYATFSSNNSKEPEPRSRAPAQSASHPLVLPLIRGTIPLLENLLKAFQTFNYFFSHFVSLLLRFKVEII
jgi:hypothetical protein